MSILVPKAHRDGSQLGMHKREWSNILSEQIYSSASIIDGAVITSGSTSLLVDGRPLITSPFTEASISTELADGIIGLRLNNLMKPTADYDMDGNTLTSVRTPTSAGEVATKYYVDQNIQGLKWKQSVRISSHLEDPDAKHWSKGELVLVFQEQTPDLQDYKLIDGNEGWHYNSSTEVLTWKYPTAVQYLKHPSSTTTTTTTTPLNSGNQNLIPTSINHVYPHPNGVHYKSANIDDVSLEDRKINFRELMFDRGLDSAPAYGEIQIGDRVLIKNATPKTMNGIWFFEQTGSNLPYSTSITHPEHEWNWSLKRALDFDHSSEVSSAAVFIEEGNKNEDKSYVVTTNTSSIAAQAIGTYDVDWAIFGTQLGDDITIYRDATQSDRFEVTGVLRDINDIFYDYTTAGNYDGITGRKKVIDGEFLVGNGTTFVAESGNDVRLSMGLGDTDSPTFANLTLTGGALTASHLISNSNNGADPITIKSNLSGTFEITGSSIRLDEDLNAKDIVARTLLTSKGNAQIDGNLNSSNNITAGKSISAQFVTASVALSASYLQLKEFNNVTEFTTTNGYPTQNSLYIANNALYFDGTQIGGSGGGGQPIENVLYYGGNIVSDIASSSTQDHSNAVLYMRLGVSGSHLSAITDAAGRANYYQILTGSFQELTGTKVDINGGTIDSTVIGGSIPAVGTFSTLNTNNAKITGGEVTGSYGKFTVLSGSDVDINGGRIDNTDIGLDVAAHGVFTNLTGSTHIHTPLAEIGRIELEGTGTPGFIANTIIGMDRNGSTSAQRGMFTQLTASQGIETTGISTLNGTNKALSRISNFTIDNTCQIDATTTTATDANFTNLKVTNLQMPQNGTTDDPANVGNHYFKLFADSNVRSEITHRSGKELLIKATEMTGTRAYFNHIEVKAGEVTASYGNFTSLTGSKALFSEAIINNAKITAGEMTGSYGEFVILSGSDVDINGGTIDNVIIGEDTDANKITHGRFDTLTGSVSYIGDPALHGSTSSSAYKSFGRFLTLSASHVEILDPDSQNHGVFEHLTGSYIRIENELSASEGATIGFGGNVIGNVGTPDTSTANRKAAVNREYIDTVVAIKTSVRLAHMDGNKNLLIDLQSGDNIDGVELAVGDRVLLAAQTDPKENGIWEVTGPGAALRPFDYATDDPIGEFIVYVKEGNGNKKSIFSITRPDDNSTGIIDTDTVVVTKISSHFGVSTAGKGLNKTNSLFSVNIAEGGIDDTNFRDRSNLTFDDRSGADPRLLLSSSIRVDALKVIDETGNTGEIFISGSADSRIDNVKIGMTTPADAQFANITMKSGKTKFDTDYVLTSSNGSTNTSIGLHKGEFEEIHVPNSFVADNNDPSGENRVIISGSLIMENSKPNNTTKRIYVKDGDLYYQDDRIGFGSGGGAATGAVTKIPDFTSIFVTGSQADGHGAFISGSLVVEGDVHIKGTTTTISSSNTTFQDSILGLGITGSDAGTEEFNNLGDRGLIFARGANQTDALPGMWWDGSKFNFAKSITSPSSGSFGTVTDRSTIRTGDVEAEEISATSLDASSVTASLGLRVGNAIDGYELPTSDGNTNQVLQTDGSGNLTFADQAAGQNSFLVKRIPITVNPTATGNEISISLDDKSPDIIYLDFANIDVATSAYSPSGNNVHYLSVILSNVKDSLFALPEREFYLGIRGFDHDEYTKSNFGFGDGGLAVRIIFSDNEMSSSPYNLRRRSTADTTTALFNNRPALWTTISDAGYMNLSSPKSLDSASFNPDATWYSHDFQFTGGFLTQFEASSAIFDRCITDDNKIFCFKYTIVKGGINEPMELVTDYKNIEIFSVNDSRFTQL
jgi:hypothetical protein